MILLTRNLRYVQTSYHDIYTVGDMVETKHRVFGGNIEIAPTGPANSQGRLDGPSLVFMSYLYYWFDFCSCLHGSILIVSLFFEVVNFFQSTRRWLYLS